MNDNLRSIIVTIVSVLNCNENSLPTATKTFTQPLDNNNDDNDVKLNCFQQVSSKDNPRFDDLVNSLREINCGGDMIDFNHKISVSFLLPSNRNEFYRYSGSLTTPPCTESVTWIVLKHGLLIGRNQVNINSFIFKYSSDVSD